MEITYVHDTLQDADFTLNSILDISIQGFWDWNALTGHVYRSIGWYRMLGYEHIVFKDDVFTWENIIHPEDYERVMEHFESYIHGDIPEYRIEYRCRKSDNTYLWIQDSGKIIEKNSDGTVIRMIGAHTNIHDFKRSQEKLLQQNELLMNDNLTLDALVKERTEELNLINKKLQEQIQEVEYNASHDRLTGLYNRRKFESIFEKEMHRAKRYLYPLSVVLFDIDDFKKINDTYGHKIGDEILIGISILVQKIIRQSDTIARWGGEEFIIIFPESDLESTKVKAETIRSAIDREIFPKNLHVTCSFGVTTYLKEDTSDSLFIRCDNALYQAKNLGKNNVQEG
jgi:diguanylate cyclase (GGDEF)-like protein/PAS domain S-box-containing protein